MILPVIVFWILLGWGLYDGDLYPREGIVFVTIWIVLLLGFLLFRVALLWFVVPTVLLDVILILKIFGQDIQIR